MKRHGRKRKSFVTIKKFGSKRVNQKFSNNKNTTKTDKKLKTTPPE